MNDVIGILQGLFGLSLVFSPFLIVGAISATVTSRRNERKKAEGLPEGMPPFGAFVLGTLAALGVAIVVLGAACAVLITSYNNGG